ncbi:mitochondrial carnitine acylcarnitine carrier protein cacl [Stylonychia lemnae]|uniref:Mitochondrial carnitine acylcarnitine carrier protein cacl n=1 Tax=Stylonychia lemnae TaxID=5949 RepID=A0A078A3S9_STYLE|nr:mitochondrial carnitine acylcarnitine carrier protein cacl [Stylonychia lemnae]|eukprot:CDW76482.1 mitochondrial carnitine acylcarnitine carrier protein cacl [Stylonychia lemnae]
METTSLQSEHIPIDSKKAIIIDLLSGTAAGALSTLAGYPLDLIKFRQQVQQVSVIKASKQIFQEGRLSGFFKGSLSPVLGNIPINSLIFAANGFCNKQFNNQQTKLNEFQKIYLSGCFAGAVSLIAFVPTELIKVRIQDMHQQQNHLYKKVVDVPTFGIYFSSYNIYQKMFGMDPNSKISDQNVTFLVKKMLAGGLAGSTTWFFAYPFDVIKSVAQTERFINHSSFQIMRHLHREHGLSIYHQGLMSCLTRAFVVNSFCFVIYEYCCQQLNHML